MTESSDGGCAFPVLDDPLYGSVGLSKRDYFAAQALAGWMATYGRAAAAEDVVDKRVTNAADLCYRLADAMLERRKT